MNGLTTIKNTVKEYLLNTGRGTKEFNKIFQLAVRGLNELQMYNLRTVKTIKDTPSDVGIIDFPDDLLESIWLYTQDGGILYPIPKKRDMVSTKTMEDGILTNNSDQGEGKSLPEGDLTYGTGTRGAKGTTYFDEDTRNRRWIIDGDPTVIFIKYISDGVDSSSDEIEYPAKARQALLSYIRYKEAFFNDKINKNSIIIYQREYDREFSKLKYLNFNMEELRQLTFATTSQNPKR